VTGRPPAVDSWVWGPSGRPERVVAVFPFFDRAQLSRSGTVDHASALRPAPAPSTTCLEADR
jgi:hypothetical protein